MSEATLYEVRRGAAHITLNQPQSRNALSDALITALRGDLERAMGDDGVRAVVLTGAGSAFCAGADLKSGGGAAVSGDDHPFVGILKAIWNAPKPVIGRINGHAFGGGIGLAAACDLAIASEAANFSFSEVRIGVIPAMISVVVIPKLGIQQSMWLFLTAERFSATRAAEIGLIHKAVPADQLDAAVDQAVESIRMGGPQAIRAAKQLVRRVPQLSMDEGFAHTAELIGKLFSSEEALEGMQAFMEKRKPKWAND
jgi:methylglutaconyl-CoA hydratase